MRTRSKDLPGLWVETRKGVGLCTANMHFYDDVFFSYALPVAWRFFTPRGEPLYIVRSERISLTTSRHCGLVRRAIPEGVSWFVWEGDCSTPRVAIRLQSTRIKRLIEIAAEARTRPQRQKLLAKADQLATEVEIFSDAMGLKGIKVPVVPNADRCLGSG